MVVLTTLIAMHFFGGAQGSGFLNPGVLRAEIEGELADSPNQGRALGFVSELEAMGMKYHQAADEAFKAYQSKSATWDSSAGDLVEILRPLDEQRTQALQGIVRIRQAMLNTLSEKEWERLFD